MYTSTEHDRTVIELGSITEEEDLALVSQPLYYFMNVQNDKYTT